MSVVLERIRRRPAFCQYWSRFCHGSWPLPKWVCRKWMATDKFHFFWKRLQWKRFDCISHFDNHFQLCFYLEINLFSCFSCNRVAVLLSGWYVPVFLFRPNSGTSRCRWWRWCSGPTRTCRKHKLTENVPFSKFWPLLKRNTSKILVELREYRKELLHPCTSLPKNALHIWENPTVTQMQTISQSFIGILTQCASVGFLNK